MKRVLKSVLAGLVCFALFLSLLPQAVIPAKAVDYVNTLPQNHYGNYDTLSMIYDQGGCYGMQGMTLDSTYTYCAKIGNNDAIAMIVRTNKSTGEKVNMVNASTGTYYFSNLGHANALDITNVNGSDQLFVTAGATLVRLTMSGTTLTTAGTYTASYNGATASMTAAQIMTVSPTEVKILVKTGRTLYTGTLDPRASSGDIALTKLCTLDITNVRLKGSMNDYSAFTQQGFDYHDGKIFLPLTGNASADTINQSVVLVYDLEGASGTIKNDPTLSFRIISGTYAGLFEIEDVAICNETGRLYFNTNRRKTSSDTNYDACSYFLSYVYDPAMSTFTPADYRWETVNNELVSVMDGGNTYNLPTPFYGSITDNVMTYGLYSLSRAVMLKHDVPWVVEWKSSGAFSGGAMLLASAKNSKVVDAPFLFRYKESHLISLGYYTGSQHNNYGIKLSDHGIDGTAEHTYRLTNKIASDGTNMVYLSVDGTELGAMNNYYIGINAQGTTDNWVSGKDFTFSYIGSFNHPLTNCKLDYLQVWADGEPVDVADTYRWETQSDDFTSVTGTGYTENTPYIYNGSISGGTYTGACFRLTEPAVLLHDKNWSIQWQSEGSVGGGTFLLSAAEGGKTQYAPFLFRYGDSGLLSIGYNDGVRHNNYGLTLSDYGIDTTLSHTYRLSNKVASDGSNMVYLSVDGQELGALNNYYVGINDQGTTSDWLNGKDLVFDYVGNRSYGVNGNYSYLQIVEDCQHSFTDWQGTNATCTSDGFKSRSCTLCGEVETESYAAVGHAYEMTTKSATCTDYEQYCFTCGRCGDSYTLDAHELATTWREDVPEGLDPSLFNSQVQYRYSDYETHTSYEPALEGYTLKSSQWVQASTGSVTYVPTWASGFDTASDVYAQYNKEKVTAGETETTKTVINSDQLVGYLWYHWCSTSVTSSWAYEYGNYNIFHTYYGTTAPSNYDCDTYDYSYYTNHSSCSNSGWWFPIEVYRQDYTNYNKQFIYERWTDFTDWSADAVTASDTRIVETRTAYQLKEASLAAHSYTSQVTAPTCTAQGYTTHTCSACGASYTDAATAATGHSYTSKVTTAAACETAGVRTYTCSACGSSYSETIPATGHSYEAVVTAPTCTENGYTTYTCHCGSSYTADEVTATGHSYEAVVTAPTCTEAGYTTYTCPCGDTYTADKVAATGHSYKRVTVNATCTTNGSITDTCTVCGDTQIETIPATGHSYEAVVTPPTCTKPGYTTYTCACGDSYTADGTAAIGHTYETVMIDATCTADGSITDTCTVCGDTQVETIPATGHSYEATVTAPTCTEAGFTTYTCHCGDSYIANEVAAIGHDYKAVITTAPGCDSAGVKTFTCANCGDTYTEAIAATGHNYEAVVTAPTCTENGYTTYTCACGHSYISDKVAALGHSYETVTVDATCTADGSITDTCSICGDTQVEIIPATGHSYEAVVTAPTCTKAGYTTYTCHCGDSYTADEVAATGHSYVDGICTVCGEADPDYVAVPTITLKYPTLSFEDTILLNVYFEASDLEDVADMGLITYSSEVTEWNVDNAEEVISGYGYSESAGLYYATTNGIPAKCLGDTLWFAVYAKLSDGSYIYTKLVSYSPRTYAYTQLNYANEKTKALVVAMLNYGAAAQTFFNYNTDALVNDALTADHLALIESYRADMMDAVPAVTSGKEGAFANTGGYAKRYPTISFEGAFCINYYYTPSYAPVDGITMYYWNQADFNAADVLTAENATGAIKMAGEGTGEYLAIVEGIAAKDLDKGIYVSFCYSDGTTDYASGVLAYSIGSYCTTQAAYETALQPFAKATAVYGYYAKQLFYEAA